MKRKVALKTSAFVLIFLLLLVSALKLTTCPADYRNYQWIAGFYEEPADSLDAVYIGGSNVYAFWIAPLAWAQHGIAVYPFACNSQPLEAARFLIEEGRKTQPEALYIVSINGIDSIFSEKQIHYLADYLPPSFNKFHLIQALSDLGGYSAAERMEFFFPLLRYHSRWSELVWNDFHYTIDGLKGGSTYASFLKKTSDISESFQTTEHRAPLPDTLQRSLEQLFAYCEEEQVKLLLVTAPQARTDESSLARLNTIEALAASYGYPVLDMMECVEQIGLDFAHDYYNEYHTNLHGAIKTTEYLAHYLTEQYNFQDKRGDPAYLSWDEAYERYAEKISPYALEFEYTGGIRASALDAPDLAKASVYGTTVTLTWKAVKGADGYQIYRKTAETGWTPLARVDRQTLSYRDESCTVGENYTYTVAAYRENNGEIFWGGYDFNGLSAQAVLDAPILQALSGTRNNLTLTWEGTPGADGYIVYRRVPEASWVKLADVGPATFYTDTNMLEDMPYQYTVRAYFLEGEAVKLGSYPQGLLWLPELSGPQATVAENDGRIVLSWQAMPGITEYTVARKTAESGWSQVAEPLDGACRGFTDLTAQADIPYLYQITAHLKYGDSLYTFQSETGWIMAHDGGIPLDPPEICFAEPVGNGVQFVWEPQEYASAYRIYRKAEGTDLWTVVKQSTTNITYFDKPPESGTYHYIIQSLHTEGGCTYFGAFPEASMCTVTFSK